ncbi:MAG TPA: ATP-dependent helicase HrpB [Chthoniobacterales bacterium]|jgi:ATP-dependent helicase HrpB|nr:ATP-dependent helicase HrpB [Chthoniobacterales bacterium]
MQSHLPIYELRLRIIESLRSLPRLILQAPTGSGKSTQVPQMLLDEGLAGTGQIIVLQPRRLPTRMLAARVAHERNVRLGEEVGYQIRLDNVATAKTRIRFVTEGILLRQMVGDPRLTGVTVLIFDEFHERHLHGDIALARALEIQASIRPDLKIVVMSATLETDLLAPHLRPCNVLTSQGRTFPVEIEYLKRETIDEPPWEIASDAFAHAPDDGGDALIFMPGAYEIARTIQELKRSDFQGIVLPLHGDLSPRAQDAAVATYPERKIIVSTNVAETSLTIDGVTLVIDSGLAKIAKYDPHRGINTLITEKISRASADQRAGRAGRTAPGRCVRLWSERDQLGRRPQDLPEVKRLDLAEVLLNLQAAGVTDLERFGWIEKPDSNSLRRAIELLEDLGALDRQNGKITVIGHRMLSFPVHPRYSRMLLIADELGCVSTIALVAAITQERHLLSRSENNQMEHDRELLLGKEVESDFFVLIRAWLYAQQHGADKARRLGIRYATAQQVAPVYEQFVEIARAEGLNVEKKVDQFDAEALGKCMLVGFSDHLAKRIDAGTLRCDLVHRRQGVLARESVVQKSPLFVAGEIREIQGRNDELIVLLSQVTGVREEWLRELFPDDFRVSAQVFFDPVTRRVQEKRDLLFRDLVLQGNRLDASPDERASELLAQEVISGRCPLAHWSHDVDQWIIRLNCLSRWEPELGLPLIDAESRFHLVQQICHGAISYKEIKDRAVWPVVKSWLSHLQQQALDQFAPARYELPAGRHAKLQYVENQSPLLAARIQDLYGVNGSLTICEGRVPILLQILAPNHRPIQTTQNLSNFWKESYPKIKQELQRKYPKHEWR